MSVHSVERLNTTRLTETRHLSTLIRRFCTLEGLHQHYSTSTRLRCQLSRRWRIGALMLSSNHAVLRGCTGAGCGVGREGSSVIVELIGRREEQWKTEILTTKRARHPSEAKFYSRRRLGDKACFPRAFIGARSANRGSPMPSDQSG